ncbi:hypothetical protein EVAR_93827_1 [Eumeta japonica]|uniref:Uncharacterized protein n=1 Tax=Eumeta variegata TaxID=151549 RepID=A0A4C1TWJ0_EUMVA|nr:hypothetical protein EVAR_93827_1 [Eumeta japonica]
MLSRRCHLVGDEGRQQPPTRRSDPSKRNKDDIVRESRPTISDATRSQTRRTSAFRHYVRPYGKTVVRRDVCTSNCKTTEARTPSKFPLYGSSNPEQSDILKSLVGFSTPPLILRGRPTSRICFVTSRPLRGEVCFCPSAVFIGFVGKATSG